MCIFFIELPTVLTFPSIFVVYENKFSLFVVVVVSLFNEWIFSFKWKHSSYPQTHTHTRTQRNSFRAGKFTSVRGENNHGYGLYGVGFCSHRISFFSAWQTKFIHTFTKTVHKRAHTWPIAQLKRNIRVNAYTINFMNEILSRFFIRKNRTKVLIDLYFGNVLVRLLRMALLYTGCHCYLMTHKRGMSTKIIFHSFDILFNAHNSLFFEWQFFFLAPSILYFKMMIFCFFKTYFIQWKLILFHSEFMLNCSTFMNWNRMYIFSRFRTNIDRMMQQ